MIRARIAWLRDQPGHDLAPLAAALDPDEAAELARISQPGRRRHYLLARALLRHVLAAAGATIDTPARFGRAESGRLLLTAPAGWHISLSHAGDLVAVVAATAPCGVDIEQERDARVAAVARRYFAPAEAKRLAEADAAAARRDFFRLWTLKEAAVKAFGEGLAGNLARLAFDLAPEEPRPAFAEPALALWQTALGDAWLAAVVATTGPVAWDGREVRLATLAATAPLRPPAGHA